MLVVNSHETIDKLDQTSGPTSSHLAQPCQGGC